MRRNMMLAVLAFVTGAAVANAQEFPKPGPEHEKLKELVGEWETVMEAGGEKSKGKAVYRSICEGMWLESTFDGEVGGARFQGRGLDGYDQNKKKHVSVWVDSMASAPMHSEGNYDPKTKLLVMTGDSVGPDGKPQKFKYTTERKDKDHMTFKMYMILPDGEEILGFTVEYTRKK
jgi:hypothetical protein